jgi:dihydroorotase
MSSVLIRNARLVNESRRFDGDLLVSNGRIVKIASSIHGENAGVEIDAQGQWHDKRLNDNCQGLPLRFMR